MATLSTTALTLADWAKRLDPMGKIPMIVELLAQTNEILEDMTFVQANNTLSHRTTVRTGLPRIYWKLLNQGVRTSKSTTAQIDEGIGVAEAWSEVNKDLAELGGNTNAVRLSEAQAFIEAMNQEIASTVFYGNQQSNPEEFTGLSPRYSSLSAGNAQNIIDGGGTGSDNTSIWLVDWGYNGVHGIFPKGSKAGLVHTNLGTDVLNHADGTREEVYQDKWQWKLGVVVRDWNCAARACNIDISDLIARGSSAAELIKVFIRLIHRVKRRGKLCFYVNRTLMQELDIQRYDKVAAAGMRYDEVDGKLMYSFRGIPIRICDALLETEARVT